MNWHSLALVDAARIRQFHRLPRISRRIEDYDIQADGTGTVWALTRAEEDCFAFTALGPGWVFDDYARQRWAAEYETSRTAMVGATAEIQRDQLVRVLGGLRLGGIAERLLWLIHSQILGQRTSLLRLPDFLLSQTIWGSAERHVPTHWRQELLEMLKGLTWFHLGEAAANEQPVLGAETALLTHVGDLRGQAGDECLNECPGHGGAAHHHYLINVGRGFLGVLEQFAVAEDEAGVRMYAFPVGGKRSRAMKTLRAVGKTGRLVSVYLPAKLGATEPCATLSSGEHRILNCLVRETTRAKAADRDENSAAAFFTGGSVRTASTRGTLTCHLLDAGKRYAGFNGNGVRHGQGYLLDSQNGWLRKAGYRQGALKDFLKDLAALSAKLGLLVVALQPSTGQFFDLGEMRARTQTPPGEGFLRQLHVRVYAEASYLESWDRYFHWPPLLAVAARADHSAELAAHFQRFGGSRRGFAEALGVDPSFLSKVLRGEKPCPEGWVAKAAELVPAQSVPVTPTPTRMDGSADLLSAALAYLRRGWAIVPQRPGSKQPSVKWKTFQTQLPTEDQIRSSFERLPDAGIAAVLGPVSGLFVIDVDGEEAHKTLVEKLGGAPVAPKVLSGSGRPFRYHLYFRHPNLKTKAKATPWHDHLEFRGEGGLIILPPSVHPSGGCYNWAVGRSADEVLLPDVPTEVLAALTPPRPVSRPTTVLPTNAPTGYSRSTDAFLAGTFADGPGWNDKLFRAACDLVGRNIPLEVAEPMLLKGARPWDDTERESAVRTIRSAYSTVRVPGKV